LRRLPPCRYARFGLFLRLRLSSPPMLRDGLPPDAAPAMARYAFPPPFAASADYYLFFLLSAITTPRFLQPLFHCTYVARVFEYYTRRCRAAPFASQR